MKKPEMIIFDYGHTLLHEPNHSTSAGNAAIYQYIAKNPNNISLEEFDRTCTETFAQIRTMRGGLEIHEFAVLKTFYELMGIELSVSLPEAERIIWEGISIGAAMPLVKEMLAFIREKGIRTGVISNICFSGNAMKERLKRILPEHEFEFVLTSSEYAFKKPHPAMFRIALQKADLTADKVWYCGDDFEADVMGAHGVGMFPVLYECRDVELFLPVVNEQPECDFEYLHIHEWKEMMDVLRGLK